MSKNNLAKSEETIRWALAEFNNPIITTGLNLSGTVLLDISARAGFAGDVIFVDTGFHFPETLSFWDSLEARYTQMRFKKLGPTLETGPLFETDPLGCCKLNKIAPLEQYLSEVKPSALINARTRESAIGRSGLKEFESGSPAQINPLVNLTRADLEEYANIANLTIHPLYLYGFMSMGCWPCTKPVRAGDDPRSGRFSGQGRTECGLWENLGTNLEQNRNDKMLGS
ncbi:MAG: phosphoadenosine phosphosulfate reductase family protein [Acidimicrobiaceae bacterium]|nr:phosphoadenosine phosphosulfate reductase family protein [Acidimicrobiaceae bacterium]